MSVQLYVKIDQNVKVNKKKVLLSDIASIHCANYEVQKELSNIMVLSVDANDTKTYTMTFLKIVELIHRKKRDVIVMNEGENEFIIEYIPPGNDKFGNKKSPKNKGLEYIKAALVCIVAFVGSAFTIMTFNMDVDVSDLFDKIYFWFMGIEKQGEPTLLEFSYCIGLPIGILVFFNHFSRKKLTSDPTPIHIEMRNYEKDINNAIIEDSSREGKTIDVS